MALPDSTSRCIASLKVEKPPSGTESGMRSVDGERKRALRPEGERECDLSEPDDLERVLRAQDPGGEPSEAGDSDLESRVLRRLGGDQRALLRPREEPRWPSSHSPAGGAWWAIPQDSWEAGGQGAANFARSRIGRGDDEGSPPGLPASAWEDEDPDRSRAPPGERWGSGRDESQLGCRLAVSDLEIEKEEGDKGPEGARDRPTRGYEGPWWASCSCGAEAKEAPPPDADRLLRRSSMPAIREDSDASW